MMNVTVMAGRLTSTPELRKTNNDIDVTSFRIAVRRDFAKKDDADATDFFDVVAWRATAEFICKFFEKGSMIQVVGRFENRRWKDKDGQNHERNELVVDKAYFGDSKNKDGDSGGQSGDIDPFPGDASEKGNTPPVGFDPFPKA